MIRGERRERAIELRLTHRLSTCEIARQLGVSVPCAKRYIAAYPLTSEEKEQNYRDALVKRKAAHPRKPHKRDPVRQRVHTHNHYVKNKGQYRERNRRTSDRIKAEVRRIKEDTPCADCHHKFHFAAMDFDHLGVEEKEFNVAQMYHLGSLAKVLREIAKCDVVCANCHRVRSYNRLMARKTGLDRIAQQDRAVAP